MREIKLRAWDCERNKMAKVTWFGFNDGELTLEDEECSTWQAVYGYTAKVMQYTGLKDKNNKEIYEGDILKERTPSGFNYSVVKFGEIDISSFSCESKMCTCFYHDFSNFNDNWGEVALGNNLKNIEVIGNIYENPELLETKL